MLLLIGFLTVVMVLVSLFLILLVLMQLPKKEAGAGLAFGAGATDALFGAGSGNFLTKATKYAAVTFFVLCIVLSVLQNHYHTQDLSQFKQELSNPDNQVLPTPPASATPAPAVAPVTTNSSFLTAPAGTSNAPVAPK